MEIKTKKLKQYNSTFKYLLLVDNEPICLFKSQNQITEALQYLYGCPAKISDGTIRKLLEKIKLEKEDKKCQK